MIEIRSTAKLQPGDRGGSLAAVSRLPALLRHEIIQGRVIQVLADQEAVIAIKERNVIARSQVPLEKDQILLLKVEQTSPTPLLRLLGSAGRTAGASLLMQASEQNPWRQVLESLGKPMDPLQDKTLLKDLLEDLSTLSQNPRSPQFLREWIEKSGLCLESRLRALCQQGQQTQEEVDRLVAGDLKGLLARMVSREEVVSPLMEKLFRVIETIQWFNHESLDQACKLFFLLPCQVSDGSWTVAQLLIQREESRTSRNGKNAGGCRVVLVSEFSNLGWVRAEVTVNGKAVGIGFLAESTESAALLQEHLPVLIGNLKARGFQVDQAMCDTLDPDLLKCSMVHELTGVGAHSFSALA